MGHLSLDNPQGGDKTLVCRLTPSGCIDVEPGFLDNSPLLSAKSAERIREAFRIGRGNGVLHLAVAELSTDLPPSLSYWRDVGRAFVGRVCGALDPMDPKSFVIPQPDPDELSALCQAAPPMPGAEILEAALLHDIWSDTGAALAAEAKRFRDGVEGYLKKHNSVRCSASST